MKIRIALAGNPNSGKTTLFNMLTGSNQFVGNWPGVTVEKKEGKLKKSFCDTEEVEIDDLPGIYSLSPYTLEEVVSRNFLLKEAPDAILNIVDGTNIERNLYLSTQLMELGIPVVIAVNMIDVVNKNGDRISVEKLSEHFGCKCVAISALKGEGVDEAIKATTSAAKKKSLPKFITYDSKIENAISAVSAKLTDVEASKKRFVAIKALEKDEKLIEFTSVKNAADSEIKPIEDAFDDDVESVITNARYEYISSMIKSCLTKKSAGALTVSDKIDRIVTNRILALPIFAVVMFLVYYVSISTLGGWLTDWVNDSLFGEGWHFLGIESLEVPSIPALFESLLESIGCNEVITGLVVDGIVAGVGAVLGFVPQIMVLFLFLAFLESCGYMARVAFIMDRIFRKFGLSGKSFIPMLVATGCGIPGIMASRTIESDRDRKMTIMTTTFMPCSAKLPIIALIAGALFDGAWWVAPSAYFVGIAAIICSGIILKKMKIFAGDPAPFVMELPAYHWPTIGSILRSMWERGWSFIKKAGTIILLSTIVLWFLMRFGVYEGSFGMLDEELLDYSILARIGSVIAPLFIPLGWGDWKMAVAAVTGLIAKENVVGTFGILFGFGEVAEDGEEIWGMLANSMTTYAAYSFLIFNLLCAPCFAAMGAIKREMNNAKWFWIAVGYQTLLAYVVSLIVFQLARMFDIGFTFGSVVGILLLVGFIYLLVRKNPYTKNAKA